MELQISMSNCYKCGKDLPAGQVECEYGCAVAEGLPDDSEQLAAEAELAEELHFGAVAARMVAGHLLRMGGNAAKLVVERDGQRVLVFVKVL
jgi:hypothetical protein